LRARERERERERERDYVKQYSTRGEARRERGGRWGRWGKAVARDRYPQISGGILSGIQNSRNLGFRV
jgi:hypothetical protein